jgi:hypothetical protein
LEIEKGEKPVKFLNKRFVQAGAALGVVTTLAMVTPRAAHAVAAALVQVTNTSANPVPNQDVDAPGRHIYQSTCTTATGDSFGKQFVCTLSAVPANRELVIQTVSILAETPNPPAIGQLGTTGGGVGAIVGFPVVNSGFSEFGTAIGSATHPLTLYADPGTQPECSITVASAPAIPSMICTVIGYTVSLP